MENKEKTIEAEAAKQARKLLVANSCSLGFLAAAPQTPRARERHYNSIFARDTAICSLAAYVTQDSDLRYSARASLLSLARFQAESGEIPNYVKFSQKRANFWRIQCIDATLWWVLSLHYYNQSFPEDNLKEKLAKNLTKALSWLQAQEHPQERLLRQNEASDWADIFLRRGFVLYTNALWCQVKKIYSLPQVLKTKKNFNLFFSPQGKEIPKNSDNKINLSVLQKKYSLPYYFSFVGYYLAGVDADIFGHSLAFLFGLIPRQKAKEIINFFLKQKRKKELPIPALFFPYSRQSFKEHPCLLEHQQNFPYQYHNGGIWPFLACFWAVALAKYGFKEEAKKELNRIARANAQNNWEFNEWFSARSGQAKGMPKQSWNAGAFLWAYYSLNKKNKI